MGRLVVGCVLDDCFTHTQHRSADHVIYLLSPGGTTIGCFRLATLNLDHSIPIFLLHFFSFGVCLLRINSEGHDADLSVSD